MSMVSIDVHTPVVVLDSIFKSFDEDDNGSLDKNQFSKLLSAIGIDGDQEKEMYQLLADENADGVISLQEFVEWVQNDEVMDIISDSNKFQMIHSVCNAFQSFNIDGNKTITFKEFSAAMVDDEFCTLEDVQDIWAEIDKHNDELIVFKEYWNYMKRMSECFQKKKPRRKSDKYGFDIALFKPNWHANPQDDISAQNDINLMSPISENNATSISEVCLNEKDIIEQLVVFGYNEYAIKKAMSCVNDKYDINAICSYLDKSK